MIKIGDKVKDKITGFTGIVIGITEWTNGCRTVGVKSLKLKDGMPQESYWIDENQLDLIKSKAKIIKPMLYKINGEDIEKNGGPQETPGRSLKPGI